MMEREQWVTMVVQSVRGPGSPNAAARRLIGAIDQFAGMPDHLFTNGSADWIAQRLKRTPTPGELRSLIGQYATTVGTSSSTPMPSYETRQQERARQDREREEENRRSWDNPQAILRSVALCGGQVHFLRLLAMAVARNAPHHLGLIPPTILERLMADPDITLEAIVDLRRSTSFDPQAPRMTRNEQVAAVTTRELEAASRHLSPEQLDHLNALPNGRKRTDEAATTRVDSPPAAASDEDVAMDEEHDAEQRDAVA